MSILKQKITAVAFMLFSSSSSKAHDHFLLFFAAFSCGFKKATSYFLLLSHLKRSWLVVDFEINKLKPPCAGE